jgi:hypothetical protein
MVGKSNDPKIVVTRKKNDIVWKASQNDSANRLVTRDAEHRNRRTEQTGQVLSLAT